MGLSKSKAKCVSNDLTAHSNKMRFKLHPKVLERLKLEFWKNAVNTLEATWLNIIACKLSFKTAVYEMFLEVCFVLSHILQRKTNVTEAAGFYFTGLGKEVPYRLSVVAVLENLRTTCLV